MTRKPCPFCKLPLVYGRDDKGFWVAHVDPTCDAFRAKMREFGPDQPAPALIAGGHVYPLGTQEPS